MHMAKGLGQCCLSDQDIADFNEYLGFVGFDGGRKTERGAGAESASEFGQESKSVPGSESASESKSASESGVDCIRNALMDEVARIFYDKNNEAFGEKQIARRLAEYMEVVRAKVQQLRGVPSFESKHIRKKGDFLPVKRTLLKTMQELLSAETELQSFSREDILTHGKTALVQNIIVDPRKITNTMLRNLGLEEFIPKDRTLSPADRIKRRAEAIPQIKAFFASDIEPILYSHESKRHPSQQSFFRLFRVRNGSNRGLVFGTQHNNHQKIPFLTDLHGAVRRIDHIESSYGKEMTDLKEIQRILEDVSTRVLSNWKEVKENELDGICKNLVDIVSGLKFVQNAKKQKIRDQIERCLTFKDCTGRINPYSRLAILSTVRKFIDSRIAETGRIMSPLVEDRMRVLSVIHGQSGALDGFKLSAETPRA